MKWNNRAGAQVIPTFRDKITEKRQQVIRKSTNITICDVTDAIFKSVVLFSWNGRSFQRCLPLHAVFKMCLCCLVSLCRRPQLPLFWNVISMHSRSDQGGHDDHRPEGKPWTGASRFNMWRLRVSISSINYSQFKMPQSPGGGCRWNVSTSLRHTQVRFQTNAGFLFSFLVDLNTLGQAPRRKLT